MDATRDASRWETCDAALVTELLQALRTLGPVAFGHASILQARRLPLPRYELREPPPAAGGAFHVRCHVHGLEPAASGEGRTRRIAEQQAAAAALQRLQSSGGRH